MQLTETIKLYPTTEQNAVISTQADTYIDTVNSLVGLGVSGTDIKRYTSADIKADLPSSLKNQCIQDAKSILRRHYKACHKAVIKNRSLAKRGSDIRITAPCMPVLKKPCFYVNNQNFTITEDAVSFPLWLDSRCRRISVRAKLTDRQKELLLGHKLGTLRVVMKNGRFVAQAVYDADEMPAADGANEMGVDLGIKCPAVSYCSDGSVKFYGNGRKNKYIRRHYKYLRKKLQAGKKIKAVKRINDKEQRIMRDIDHKISREIIDTAVEHDVSVIKLETLAGIRRSARQSRKNNHSLHTWSFYRLAKFIEYKAALAGIEVIYVEPEYTSQICPACGKHNHAEGRYYRCGCGFHAHRDIVGAMNILRAAEAPGDRASA